MHATATLYALNRMHSVVRSDVCDLPRLAHHRRVLPHHPQVVEHELVRVLGVDAEPKLAEHVPLDPDQIRLDIFVPLAEVLEIVSGFFSFADIL